MTTHTTQNGVTVTLPDRLPRSANDLPSDIDGTPVKLFDMPDPVVTAFTRSQLARMTKEQFAEHAEAIKLAEQNNLIIDDVTPPEVFEAMDKAAKESADRMLEAVKLSHARKDVDASHKALQDARAAHEHAKDYGDQHEIDAAERRAAEAATAFDTANSSLRELSDATA